MVTDIALTYELTLLDVHDSKHLVSLETNYQNYVFVTQSKKIACFRTQENFLKMCSRFVTPSKNCVLSYARELPENVLTFQHHQKIACFRTQQNCKAIYICASSWICASSMLIAMATIVAASNASFVLLFSNAMASARARMLLTTG